MRKIAVSAAVMAFAFFAAWHAGSAQQKKKTNIVAFSPDGKHQAIAKKHLISIVDVKTKKELVRMNGHKTEITALEYSPDGKHLASAAFADRNINVWQMKSGRLIFRITGSAGIVDLQYSADGKMITAVDNAKTERVFDSATGKLIRIVRKK